MVVVGVGGKKRGFSCDSKQICEKITAKIYVFLKVMGNMECHISMRQVNKRIVQAPSSDQ